MKTAQAIFLSSPALFEDQTSNESLILESPSSIVEPHSKSLLTPLTLCALITGLWLAWRVWTFTVMPKLYPHRPKVYPYWVPWLGHSLDFVFNAEVTLNKARRHFGNTRAPFSFVLGGRTVHMITSAKDTTAVFRNPTQLTFNTYIQDMLFALRHFREWSPHNLIMESTMKTQLTPGDAMMTLQSNLLDRINQNLSWDLVPAHSTLDDKSETKVISLLQWTKQCLLRSVTVAFYGEAIFRVEPAFLEIFASFDENGWKLPYRVPAMFSKNMTEPKDLAQAAFKKYFELPQSERADACWMVHAVEDEMRVAGIQSDDISKFLLMVYWGINTNTWKAAYWMLANIVFNENLKKSIEEEIFQHTRAETPLSSAELQSKLEKSPLLVATYNETLRLYTSSTAARDVSTECVIGGMILEKDTRLVIPYRQMQLDEEVFGLDAGQFRPDRFVQKPSLAQHPSFRPFGGGLAYCPGRFIAQKEITYFNAIMLSRFQFELLDPSCSFPKMNTQKPCSGVCEVALGHDLVVKVKQRP